VNVCGPETGARAATVLVSVNAECINSDGRRDGCVNRAYHSSPTPSTTPGQSHSPQLSFLVSSHMTTPNISEADSGFGPETHLLVAPSAEANRTREDSVAGLMLAWPSRSNPRWTQCRLSRRI
jgi:hypothetical protein